MDTKLFELRDRATFMPILCTRMVRSDRKTKIEADAENYLLSRAGYSFFKPLILMTELVSNRTQYDTHWGHSDRTLGTVHRYITEHWDELRAGQVIDVEFILGETHQCKVTEMFDDIIV